MKQFFHALVTEGDPKSSRRFVTLIIALLFILTASTIPVLLVLLFTHVHKLQGLNTEAMKAIIDLVKTVLQYEFWIIAAGLFVTTIGGRIEMAKALFQKKETYTTEEYSYTDQKAEPYDPISESVPGSSDETKV